MSADTEPVGVAGLGETYTETPEEIEFELRCAEGAAWTGSRILIGIVTFFFASLAFAYFYLRSSNSEQLWRPSGATAPTGTGAAIALIAVAGAVLALYGASRLRTGSFVDWQVAGWTVVGGGLLAVVLQCWELTSLPFSPGSSGYASCFVGWAIMNIVLLMSGVYWTETMLARALRLRRAAIEEGGSSPTMSRLFMANLQAQSHYWGAIAVISLLFWVLFYVI
jgi:heme/copper-type cytochrome/quinol oxidase subunit 3